MIADWVPFVTLAAGFVTGFAVRRRSPQASKPEEPICPCGHAVAYHERGVGPCRVEQERRKYNGAGTWVGHMYVLCRCQNYAGPEVISSITMRPAVFGGVADESIDREEGRL